MKKVVASVFRRWTSMSLVLRILIGLVIGAVLGLSLPDAKGISILGTVFVGALKAIAPVLVAVLVASALSKAHSSLGPRFRTVVTLILNGKTTQVDGIVNGRISDAELGTGGFGYDSVFIPDGYQLTFAQLGEEIKNTISHRARAMQALADILM